MKILVVGGGSGGHITPAVAVVRKILELKPRASVEFWTDFKYYKNVTKITTELGVAWGGEATAPRKRGSYIRVRRIPSGKLHRYAGWGIKDYFTHFDILLKDLILGNILGFLGFLGGILTSFGRFLKKSGRPDVIFLKGGYVSLPVGIMAGIFRIPYVIHESDMTMGLANRILMKKASRVAFGMPIPEEVLKEHKNYVWTGIPVGEEFRAVSKGKQASLKKAFGFCSDKPLVVITGGSQGSENLNEATRAIVRDLLEKMSVGLVAGRKHYEKMIDLKKYENWDRAKLESDFRMWEFCTTMDELLGAADVVVSRAGATTIAELAALKKAVILVPFAPLPGKHQVKNAERLAELGAVEMVADEKMVEKPEILKKAVLDLAKDEKKRGEMVEKLHREAKGEAAEELAKIVLEVGEGK